MKWATQQAAVCRHVQAVTADVPTKRLRLVEVQELPVVTAEDVNQPQNAKKAAPNDFGRFSLLFLFY